ncbi:hypothetical protein [Anaeromyxobacter oryzae]|uniref:ATP-grasp ribosomal peptide maturase n=1 Tax=Anaeromyxobacter oryzae TaxID=2918170 RepID=A0ABN6MZW3_9BACT|nr:hypothetical protein [Anaeromyxobacter oryzae]BDG05175.1 ATP-grasp ribosomal peptide maturase [Anaeromyxobacter oryzae]
MSTLILGFPNDIHIHAVRWALDQVSARSEVLYTSDLPQVARTSIRVGGGAPPRAQLRLGALRYETGAFDAVWFRRSGRPVRPHGMTDADWTITERECDHHVRALRRQLGPGARWLNDPDARERALLKPLQLEAAQATGFAVPETLFSNDPDEIRAFYSEFRECGVVFKLNVMANWHAQAAGDRFALFTTVLREDDLRDDEAISSCPGIYQRKIEKRYELRVTCMDEACFAARLDSQERDGTRTDWRADFSRPLPPRPVALPRHVEQRCLAFMKRMGLAFGCIDLIVTPEGEYVFLEVNEMGQFLWVEEGEPAFPLLRAFATLLVERKLSPGSRLVGTDALSYRSFLASGAWEAGRLEDAERHAAFEARGVGVEP